MGHPSLSALNLGPLDADDDKNLERYFIPFGDFELVRDQKLFVIVGPKGTGKSAIKKHLISLRARKPTITLDEVQGFTLSDLGTQSPVEIKAKVKGYLTALILNYLKTSGALSATAKGKLKRLGEESSLLEKLLTPLTINAGIAEYAVRDLFPKNKRSELQTVLDPKVAKAILECLGTKDLWILVDNIDNIFTSDNEAASLSFVEGLIYSASDLNIRVFDRSVWIVLLLRAEIYEELTRKATELDKRIGYIWEIAWEGESLMRCLEERIRWAFGAERGQPSGKYISLLFETDSDVKVGNLREYLVTRVINGPRDLLLLVDMSRRTAAKRGASRISLADIQASEYEYGQMKLRQILSNFQRIYKEIDLVAERLFRGQSQTYTRKDLEKHIDRNLLTNPTAREDFKELGWLRKCTAFSFMEILYRVGLIGYLDPVEKRYIYVLEKSKPDRTLISSAQFQIHSAFKGYLELS